jgi:hypothetical protein
MLDALLSLTPFPSHSPPPVFFFSVHMNCRAHWAAGNDKKERGRDLKPEWASLSGAAAQTRHAVQISQAGLSPL